MAITLISLFLLTNASFAFAASTYYDMSPAAGTTSASAMPLLSVKVSDPAGISGGYQLKIDGASKTPKTKWGPGNAYVELYYQPTSALTNGNHTIYASVLTGAGRTSTTWTFKVGQPPTIGPLTPADGATVNTQKPTISAVVNTAGGTLASQSMTVDGAFVASTYDAATKTVSYTPALRLANGRIHSATLTATDSSGASTTVTWSFTVQVYASMVDTRGCTECHTAYPASHPMTNCDGCHAATAPFPAYWNMEASAPHDADYLLGIDCSYCHAGVFPTVPSHTADVSTQHIAGSDMSGCSCHVSDLTIEHNRYLTSTGDAFTCATCHESTNPQVQAGMAAGTRRCADCHTIPNLHPYGEIDHLADINEIADLSGKKCVDCHDADLLIEHEKATASSAGDACATCHDTPRDSFEAWNQTCSQGGCHAAGSATAMHGNQGVAHARSASADTCDGSGCHSGDVAALHAGVSTTVGAITVTSCSVCHAPGVTPTKDCSACHSGHGDLNPIHAATVGNAAITIKGNTYDEMPCADCHASSSLLDTHNNTCATCHPTAYDSVAGNWDKSCSQGGCHTTGAAAMHGGVDAAHTVDSISCTDAGCHEGEGDIAMIHETVGCDACHGAGKTPSTACADCHDTETPHGDVTATHAATVSSADFSISGVDFGTKDCADCHEESNLLDVHPGACVTCHPDPRNSVGEWNKGCSVGDCHTLGNPNPMHGAIDAAHEHDSVNASCFEGGCHTDIASTSVAAIHKDVTVEVDGVTRASCGICHVKGQTPTRDCLSCHPERAQSHGYEAAAHAATPAAADITIAGETFAGMVCADCHKLELKPEHSRAGLSSTGACSECHAALVGELNGWTKGCAQGGCHTAGSDKPMHGDADAAHARPASADSCAESGCHADVSVAALHKDKSQTVGEITRTSCQICHAEGVTGANDCTTCHDMGSPHGPIAASHTAELSAQPISFGGRDYGTHECTECHASDSLLTLHANQCTTCHPAPKDSLEPAWQKGCAQGGCHTAGTSAPMHDGIVIVHAVTRNACSTVGCHYTDGTSVAALHATASTVVEGQTRTSCQICHAPGVTPSTDCATCHDLGSPHVDTTLAHSGAPVGCTGASCHGEICDVSNLHTAQGCQTCHFTGTAPTAECATCHTNSAYAHGYTVENHTGELANTVTILGKGYSVQCASCHDAATGEMDLKPVHVAVGKGACTQCHPMIVPDVVTTWDGTCAQAGCHGVADSQPEHVRMDEAHAMMPVAKDCLAGGRCHVGGSLPEIHENASTTVSGEVYSGCQVCHKNSVATPEVPVFVDPNGSEWTNECLGCHADRWEQHGYEAAWHQSTVTSGEAVIESFTETVQCADCHDAELAPEHTKVSLGCDNCHPSPRDAFTTWNKGCQQANCHTSDSTSPMHDEITPRHLPTEHSAGCVIDGCHLGHTIAPGWGTNLPEMHKNATAVVNGQTVSSCMVCHYNNEYRPNSPTEAPAFSCDAQGIPNTRECDVCHPQGENVMHAYSFVNHDTSNLTAESITIGATTWPAMACTRCHYTELSSEHARNVSDFKSKGCANCHPAPYESLEAEGQVIGGWNKTCVQAGCHADGSPTEMHADATAHHTPLSANAGCMATSACHSAGGATLADLHSQATTTVAGVTRTSCDVCHGDFKNQSMPPSQDCNFCHPQMWDGSAVIDHVNENTLHPSTSAASCSSDESSCHSKYLMKEHKKYAPSAGGTFTCATCHDSTDPTTLAAITGNDTRCEACHTSAHGAQETASNTSCLDCHGASSVEMSAVSTDGAYANTAGDHTYFTSSAHNTIQTTPTVGAQDTSIQCTVCHNHSRDIEKAIEYRYTGWPNPEQNHEDLCYQCHTSQVTFVNEPNKPNAWNGRSVQADFQRYSKHTISTGDGSWVDQEVPTALSDATVAAFNAEVLSNLQVATGPIVKLAQDTSGGTNPAAQTGLLFGKVGGATALSQYKAADNAWNGSNSALFTPTVAPGSPVSGSTMFRIPNDNRIFLATAATAYVYTPPVDPAADSWTTNTAFAAGATVGAGGDTAVNTTGTATTGQVIYYTRGGSSNYIQWKPFAGSATATYGRIQYPSGTTLNQGQGSALAFAPMSNRIFVINKNGTSGNGRLYYYTGFNRPANTNLVFTQGPQIANAAGTTSYNRLTCATINNVDYLFSLGTSSANAITLQVVTNVATTPAILSTGIKAPSGWTTLGDGVDLQYNAADGYLYAIRGGGNAGIARIQVPANPGVASSWTGVNWTVLSGTQTWPAGSSIVFADADPLTTVPFKYFAAGTLTTASDVSPVAGSIKWGKLDWAATVPANATLGMKVEGYQGGAWTTLVANATSSPVDLSAYTTASITKMRVTATFSTSAVSDTAATPQLTSLTLTSIKQTFVPASGSMIQCESCHNTHLAQKGTGSWSMARVSNPANTKQAWTGTPTDFCLTCHTGTKAAPQSFTPVMNATQMIPYNVAFRSVNKPFFPGFSKTQTGMTFKSSGHWTTTSSLKAGCENCHDPHGSDNPELTAFTPTTGATAANSRINTGTASLEENLCYKCHGTGAVAVGGRQMDVQGPSTATYGHQAMATYSKRHSNEETMGTNGIAASRHVECSDCHDAHASVAGTHTAGASTAGLVVKGAYGIQPTFPASNWTAPSAVSYNAVQMTGTQAEALLCFKCHAGPGTPLGSVTTGSGTYTRTDLALEFNPNNFSVHNVMGSATGMKSSFTYTDSGGTSRTQTFAIPTANVFAAGWNQNSKVTCTDCHTGGTAAQAKGPHGSSVKYMIDPAYTSDWRTAYLVNSGTGMRTSSDATGATVICAKCHDLYGTAFSNGAHGDSHHRSSSRPCVACHIAIPHGWKRPRLLVNAARDAAPYLATGRTTSNTFAGFLSTTNHTGTTTISWAKGDCQGCGEHGTKTPYMP
ncbi:MAG TPA: cytochrome c3 family protein [Coriobacteriia bacterium]|nr:cytochrome c3 family protein [Coriobacteriia bacterium]